MLAIYPLALLFFEFTREYLTAVEWVANDTPKRIFRAL